MKVILSGGGTGGHIYPALTIADQIKNYTPRQKSALSVLNKVWKRILFPVMVTH